MSAEKAAAAPGIRSFRAKLLAGMTVVVVAITLIGLYLVERKVTSEAQQAFQRAFEADIGLIRTMREIRHATLAERCRILVRKPRIHAALEDNALDLLYLSAGDELRDVLDRESPPGENAPRFSTRARFYRFLDAHGALISPGTATTAGPLDPEEEKRLALPEAPGEEHTGYLWRRLPDGGREMLELIATPIVSTESGDIIAALVTGFPLAAHAEAEGVASGILLGGELHMPSLKAGERAAIAERVARVSAGASGAAAEKSPGQISDGGHLIFFERLNPGSMFPAAFEVGVYPLAALKARQFHLRIQAAGIGLFLLVLGIAASSYIAARLAEPVRQLAIVSEENRVLRERAESDLEITSRELERTARFSADASHQLKTPVTVMRAGLDELLARDELPQPVREEISLLVHQTFRITSIIDDLLLLAKLDSGRLQIEMSPVDLTHVIDTCVDDLHLTNEGMDLVVLLEVPAGLHISGEKRYTMLIVQNLVDNARKYNLPGGRIRIATRRLGREIVLTIGNNAKPIPRESHEHIFERFHRAAVGENVPGHGLGLNLARELARLQGGDLRLLRSDPDWTEFEVRFQAAAA